MSDEKMLDTGDQIMITATCLYSNDEGYLFTLSKEIPFEKEFKIELSKSDEEYNKSVHEALYKLKVK